jgi:hypothetical protein
MIRRAVLAAAACLMPAFSLAQDAPLPSLEAAQQAWEAACAEAPDGSLCRASETAFITQAMEALTRLGFSSDRGASLAAVRQGLRSPVPQFRMAAAWALANLGPEPEDLEILTDLLQERIPEVRAAALGALRRLADPKAVALAKRAQGTARGDLSFTPSAFPFDPASPSALGLASWPQDAQFLFFDQPGLWLFTTSASRTDTVSFFASMTGQAARPLAEADPVPAERVKPLTDRGVTDITLIPLKPDDAPVHERGWVAVYDDPDLGRTGFAPVYVQWPQVTPVEAPPEPVISLNARGPAQADLAAPLPDLREGEGEAFADVLRDDGAGIDEFLAAYPGGPFAEQAQKIAASPRFTVEPDFIGDPGGTVTIAFKNLPAGEFSVVGTASPENGPNGDAVAPGTRITGPEGTAQIEIREGVPPGALDLAIVDADGSVLAYRQLQVESVVTLDLPETKVAPGAPLTIKLGGLRGTPTSYVTSDALEITREDGETYTRLFDVNVSALEAGEVTVRAPDEPGSYVARVFLEYDLNPGNSADPPPPQPRAAMRFTVEGEPAAAPAPETFGSPALALLGTPRPGETFAVSVSGLSGMPDRPATILVVEAGAPDTERGQNDRIPDRMLGGPVALSQVSEGRYEIRLTYDDLWADMEAPLSIVARLPVTVGGPSSQNPEAPEPEMPASSSGEPAPAPAGPDGGPLETTENGLTLTLQKSVFAANERIGVTVKGLPGNDDDWITIVEADKPDTAYGTWAYTKGAREGTFDLQGQRPGAYEVRVYFDDSSRDRTVRARLAFTVK